MMIGDDNDGQMIFGDLEGLKLPDICLTGEEKQKEKKKPHPGNCVGRVRHRSAVVSTLPTIYFTKKINLAFFFYIINVGDYAKILKINLKSPKTLP